MVTLAGAAAALAQISARTAKRERANLAADSVGRHEIVLITHLKMVAYESKSFQSTCGCLSSFPRSDGWPRRMGAGGDRIVWRKLLRVRAPVRRPLRRARAGCDPAQASRA